jgi:hypothetical protein
MGMCCWTVCDDCDAEAPEMGDAGFLGYPSMDDAAGDCDAATFGSIHRALSGAHLVTSEVDAFREFLEKHKGHHVVTETEDGPAFGEGDEDDEDDEDGEFEEDDIDGEDDMDDEEDEDEEDFGDDEEDLADEGEGEDAVRGRYVVGRYRASCAQCGAAFSTNNEYELLPFERADLTAQHARDLRKNVIDVLDDSCYHAEPLWDDDLEGVVTFIEKHAEHGVMAEVVPAKTGAA